MPKNLPQGNPIGRGLPTRSVRIGLRSRLLTLFMGVLVSCSPGYSADWPQWLGPDRNGVSSEGGWIAQWPKAGLKTLWKAEVGTGFSGASVVGERVYTCGHRDGFDLVYGLSAKTGEILWESKYPCDLFNKMDSGGPAATPLVTEDRVVTFSRLAEVRCWSATDGSLIWAANPQIDYGTSEIPLFGFTASPLLAGENVVVDAGVAAAYRLRDGKLAWKTVDYKATCSSPQIFPLQGEPSIALFNTPGLILLDPHTGREIRRKPWPTEKFDTNTSTPIVVGNRMFISSGYDGGGGLLDLSGTGEPSLVWGDPLLRTYYNTKLEWRGSLYGFNDQTLICSDFETGETRWTQTWPTKGCLVIVDGKLLILSEKGELVLADASPDGYSELGRTQNLGGTCWNIPVVANGRLYLRNSTGLLVCLDLRLESYP